MSGELLHRGDPPQHVHQLPEVPDAYNGRAFVEVENAVARCEVCGRLFVSRYDPDAWGPHLRWVPLRWWHRQAHRNLRAPSPTSEGETNP